MFKWIYKAVSKMVNLQQENDMVTYLGQVESHKDEFNYLMRISDSVDDQERQRDKFSWC